MSESAPHGAASLPEHNRVRAALRSGAGALQALLSRLCGRARIIDAEEELRRLRRMYDVAADPVERRKLREGIVSVEQAHEWMRRSSAARLVTQRREEADTAMLRTAWLHIAEAADILRDVERLRPAGGRLDAMAARLHALAEECEREVGAP